MTMELPAVHLPAIRKYLDLLEEWNHIHALTALPLEARFEELILDALTLLPGLEPLPAGARVVDFGTGMGIPALPLALLRPDLEIVALDASAKKIAFVRQAGLELGLANLRPLHGRAEALAPLAAHAGMAKAVGSLDLLLGWWVRHRREDAPFFALKVDAEAPPCGWHMEALPYELPTRGRRTLLKLTT